MSRRVPDQPRRLLVLLCCAVVGVLVVLGLAVLALAGLPGLLAYAAVALVLVAFGVVRGRRLLAPPSPAPPLPAGRTCTCCTTTHHDPVKVI